MPTLNSSQYVKKNILRKIYPKRDPWVHKGRFGRLALISGSERHTGSACFAGMAAYKAAQSKNTDNILTAADAITEACANCHNKYREKPDLADRCK